jgi:hypothetical protein
MLLSINPEATTALPRRADAEIRYVARPVRSIHGCNFVSYVGSIEYNRPPMGFSCKSIFRKLVDWLDRSCLAGGDRSPPMNRRMGEFQMGNVNVAVNVTSQFSLDRFHITSDLAGAKHEFIFDERRTTVTLPPAELEQRGIDV